jgi:hypothetical protein
MRRVRFHAEEHSGSRKGSKNKSAGRYYFARGADLPMLASLALV